jgi:hypothetical protein
MDGERIVMAAIKTSSVNVATVLKPGRHKDIISHLQRYKFNTEGIGKEMYGFITSEGSFVGRREARSIALECGQIKRLDRPELHSEDVW